MAPVWLFECGSFAGGGAAADEVTMLLVADVTSGVELGLVGVADVVENKDDEELSTALELDPDVELDGGVELTPELLGVVVGVVAADVLILLDSRLLEFSVTTVLEPGSSVASLPVTLLGTVTVPRVVGSAKLTGVAVKLNVSVSLSGAAVIPLAEAATLVARSLAVPQPYWEKPPSKTFW
jgi:hypothetical protein